MRPRPLRIDPGHRLGRCHSYLLRHPPGPRWGQRPPSGHTQRARALLQPVRRRHAPRPRSAARQGSRLDSASAETRARAQALLLRLSCGAEQARVVLHVLGPTRGTRVRGLEASVRQEGPALPSPQSSTASEGEEAPAPAPCTDAYTCSPVNNPSIVPGDEAMPLSAGNCTDWAEYKRPDIWYNQAANDPLGQDWDAWTWAEHAQAEGLSVGAVPQVGDIAVWQPNTAHSGPVGHVAYVESVGQGSITVSEMNAPFDPVTLKTPEGYTYYESTLTEAELTEQSVQFIAPAS